MKFKSMMNELFKFIDRSLMKFKDNAGIERLSMFSEWLSQYDNNNNNNYHNENDIIYLPISNTKHKIIISSFNQHISILTSIRLPKKVIVYGNDEKSYSFLIKGCEDLRQDQRIEEIFKLMNTILNKHSPCAKNKISLKTFDVIPMTKKLGIIEWINNTTPLNNIISFSMQNLISHQSNWTLHTSAPMQARQNWYSKLGKNLSLTEQHLLALISNNHSEIIKAFISHVNLMPKRALKRALVHYLTSAEDVLITKTHFIRNYSALSIACYILGIGDRHLDNFLINTYNSEVVAIDFGISFGKGLTQLIPELVPYRLTNQIVNVMHPEGILGVIRQTMIEVLSAFKGSKNNVLDYCEVFVKEPLLDWGIDKENESIKKVEIVNMKLNGYNPVKIMLREINAMPRLQSKIKDILKTILYGINGDNVRLQNKNENYVDIDIQVDILNELATDPNLLGRMWIGWSPFI